MTNFELITQNPLTLEDFLSGIQDDALTAKGCSLDLHWPPCDAQDVPYVGWKEWLEQEAEDEKVYAPNGIIERL